MKGGVSADVTSTLAVDDEQAPERELDGLLLASNQEPCVSGANRV